MTDFAYAPQNLAPLNPPRIWPAIRYAGVLLVWLGLILVRPRLGLEIFANRRENSPLRRSNRKETSKPVEKPRSEGHLACNWP